MIPDNNYIKYSLEHKFFYQSAIGAVKLLNNNNVVPRIYLES